MDSSNFRFYEINNVIQATDMKKIVTCNDEKDVLVHIFHALFLSILLRYNLQAIPLGLLVCVTKGRKPAYSRRFRNQKLKSKSCRFLWACCVTKQDRKPACLEDSDQNLWSGPDTDFNRINRNKP